MNSNQKKAAQLGMPLGTASNRLRKAIIFNLVKRLGENYCYRCGSEIVSEADLSIEHKIPYLDSDDPVKLFFDLDNISFSHLICNIRDARQTKISTHPSLWAYRKGCRCDECRELEKLRRRSQRERGINT